ncbi:MAG: PD-(D/E)XK nuclease family protein [Myxococcota bacterium]
MQARDAPQLPLFGDEGGVTRNPSKAPRPVLRIVRSRGLLWEQPHSWEETCWTLEELLERIRELGFAERPASHVLDDDALLWTSAATLARRSRLGVRLAADLATLVKSTTHEAVDARAIASRLHGAGGREGELAQLFAQVAEVRAVLESCGVVDAAAALAAGVDCLRRGHRLPALAGFRRVEIEDPIDLTPLELEALVALARSGEAVQVILPRVEGHDGLAEGVNWIANAFEAAWDAPRLELVHRPVTRRGALREFVDAWYRPALGLARADSLPARVEVLADPFDEARRIAGVVARWRREEGPPRVAVALRSFGPEAIRLADALRGYGVPLRLSQGQSLAETASGRLLLDVLRARRQGAPRELLLAILASPVFVDRLAADKVGALSRLLRRAVARSDVEDASHPEGGYRHRLERLAASLRDPDEVQDIHEALNRVEQVLSLIRRVPLRGPLEAQLAVCVELLKEAFIDDETDARIELLAFLQRGLGTLARVSPQGTRETDIAATLRFLQRALGGIRLAPPRVDEDTAVDVLTIPELFGREWDYVVLADLQHGKVPLAVRSDPLLGDSDRVLINRHFGRRILRLAEPDLLEPGVVAPRLALEPLWFIGAMASARRGILLTAPARDRGGRDVAPSEFFIESMLALGAEPTARAAGSPFTEEPHPRQAAVALAQRVSRGEPDDDGNSAAHARLLTDMSRQRRAFFEDNNGELPRNPVTPFAFALSPTRVARNFGRQLGLLSDKPLGPTRLEALATCAMRGYVEHLLQIDTDPEAGQDADARTLGKLAHGSLERFFRERRDAGVEPARMEAADRARLRAIVDEEARSYMEGGEATGHLAALAANVAWLSQSLVRTVTSLARNPPVQGAVPRYFELKVGTRGYEETTEALGPLPLQIGGQTLYFGGEIDRVDEGDGVRVIVDYKHSTARAVYKKLRPESLLTTHFQLPLYMRILEQGALATSENTELLGYLVSLRDGAASDVIGHGGVLRRRLFDEQAQTGFPQAVARVLLPILEGIVVPMEGEHCDGCRLSRICRIPSSVERGLQRAGEGPSSTIVEESRPSEAGLEHDDAIEGVS